MFLTKRTQIESHLLLYTTKILFYYDSYGIVCDKLRRNLLLANTYSITIVMAYSLW